MERRNRRQPQLSLPGDGEVKDYLGVAWKAALRQLPRLLRDELRSRQLWEDIQQEIALAAFIAQQGRFSLKETWRLVDKAVYEALVNMGLRKPRGGGKWERMEVTETEYLGDGEHQPLAERAIFRQGAVLLAPEGGGDDDEH